jgi:Trypsin-like peptidase domain
VRRLLALLISLSAVAGAVQQPGVLKIKVTVVDASGQTRPVPRHALLISDNPVSAAPQRVVTAIDGTAEARLKPGNYTIESDEPLVFGGKIYEWTRTLDVPAGRDTVLELTADNAQVGTPIDIGGGAATAPPPGSASALLIDWQDSVVTIWSPTQIGSGFVIDARGLIATNQRLVGRATDVEVQMSPSKKVTARVVAADPTKDVAILWIDPTAIAGVKPMALGYARDGAPPVGEKEKLFAIEAPLDDRRRLASGIVSKVTPHTIVTNVNLDERSAGVPLLTPAGQVVAITTTIDDDRAIHDIAPAAVRIDDARATIAEAEKKIQGATPPPPTPLPVEPERPFDDEGLSVAAKGRAGRMGAYMLSAEDFDVGLITPVMLYASRHREERTTVRGAGRPEGNLEEMIKSARAVQNLANWEDYVFDYPPVVMIRATPKSVENFWTSLGRAAAQSQGVDIPGAKHLKTGFARLRLHCGDREVTPIHPFRIEQRVGEREFVYEGLYVFAPDAIGPQCGTVKLTLFSDKTPDKGDPRTVDAKIVRQIWDDFATYRAASK